MTEYQTEIVTIEDCLYLTRVGDGIVVNSKENDSLLKCGYEVKDLIGQGGYSMTYKAYSKKDQREVAIKVMRKSIIEELKIYKFVQREIATMQLSQQHILILDLYETIQDRLAFYLILEYAPNGSLLDYVNKYGFLSEASSRVFFSQILEAVDFLHGLKIIHRNVKLSHILLDAKMNVLLSGFNLATFMKEKYEGRLKSNCGTLGYAAPEILIGAEMYDGIKVDVWSCGVCLYAMLFGKLPFKRDTDVFFREVYADIPFPRQVTKAVRRTLTAMLNPDPGERPVPSELRLCNWMAIPLDGSGIEKGGEGDQMKDEEEVFEGVNTFAFTDSANRQVEKSTGIVGTVLQAVVESRTAGRSIEDLEKSNASLITGLTGPLGEEAVNRVITDARASGSQIALNAKPTPKSTLRIREDKILEIIGRKRVKEQKEDRKVLHNSMAAKMLRAANAQYMSGVISKTPQPHSNPLLRGLKSQAANFRVHRDVVIPLQQRAEFLVKKGAKDKAEVLLPKMEPDEPDKEEVEEEKKKEVFQSYATYKKGK